MLPVERTADPSASAPPDFLWSLLALANLMRLSSLKAALGLATPLSLTGNPEEAEGPAVLRLRPPDQVDRSQPASRAAGVGRLPIIMWEVTSQG
jgi:hypothetical protein